MAVNCPQGSICSDPYSVRVGQNGTNLYFHTSTVPTRNTSGQVTGGTTTLYYSPTPGSYVAAATTNDGGRTWTYLKNANDQFIMGDSARRSLQEGSLKTTTNEIIRDVAEENNIPRNQSGNLTLNNNTETTNAEPPPQGGGGNNNRDEDNDIASEITAALFKFKKGTKGVKSYGNLKYPLALNANPTKLQDTITFTMIEYAGRGLSSEGLAQGDPFLARNIEVIGGTVTLPIQGPIADSNRVKWSPEEMNAKDAAAAAAGLGLAGEGSENSVVDGVVNLLGNNNEALSKAIKTSIIEGATGTKGLLTRLTGAIMNPNLELLFGGPELREFSFTFKMSARSKEESKSIKQIIRFFKQGMSVKRSEIGLFLKSPHIFKIQYNLKGDVSKPHPWLNIIKVCALQSCSVNYTPNSTYSTFRDGAMTSYEIQLQFNELEPVYDDDYEPYNENFIGY